MTTPQPQGQQPATPIKRCASCGAETDWLIFDTVTEAKRGIPCETCNK